MYRQPKYNIEDKKLDSTVKKQRTGSRQGCPLSPYLLIIVMTVMLHHVHEDLDPKLEGKSHDFVTCWELLYADDTLILSKHENHVVNTKCSSCSHVVVKRFFVLLFNCSFSCFIFSFFRLFSFAICSLI